MAPARAGAEQGAKLGDFLHRVEAVYLSFVTLATPIFAVILGAIVLGEILGSQVFAGAALVLVGLAVANSGEFTIKRKGKTVSSSIESTTTKRES